MVSPAGATEAGMVMPLWAPALQAQMQELASCKGHEANVLIMSQVNDAELIARLPSV